LLVVHRLSPRLPIYCHVRRSVFRFTFLSTSLSRFSSSLFHRRFPSDEIRSVLCDLA
jgi:hypothetical protein